MVESARSENAEVIQRRRADDDGRQHGFLAGEGARGADHESHGQAEEQGRPSHPRDILGKRRIAGSFDTASTKAAIGASTSRDQCMTKPPSSPILY